MSAEKKKVLFTGGTGFVGKNVIPFLKDDNIEIIAPTRAELNLFDYEEVKNFVTNNRIQVVIHSANPNPAKNSVDESINMFKGSLEIFMNFYRLRDCYEKMLYIGSGAEYDKRYDIVSATEDQIGIYQPTDEYGFAKFIMNELARKSENIYNLRLFACYGPYDFSTKFITHAITCCLNKEPLTIRQDCWFDYLHVYDFAKMLKYFIINTPKYHDYNICSGTRVKLSQIAAMVIDQMQSDSKILLLKEGMNKEYTADNTRLLKEFDWKSPISLEEGIALQIEWEKKLYEKKSC